MASVLSGNCLGLALAMILWQSSWLLKGHGILLAAGNSFQRLSSKPK